MFVDDAFSVQSRVLMRTNANNDVSNGSTEVYNGHDFYVCE